MDLTEEKKENPQGSQPQPDDDLSLLDLTEVKEEDTAQFDRDMIVEPEQDFTAQQRENLYQRILKMSVPQRIRLAMLGNREARKILIHDRNKVIQTAVLRSPKLSENEIMGYVQQRNTPEDVIHEIAKSRIWTKKYQIKRALVFNPKTPLVRAIQLLDHLYEKDLQALSRDKNISPPISQAAWQLFKKRKP